VGDRVSSPDFVGRLEQLDALQAALQRADEGEARAVFVAGESGVGKSRLVAEFEGAATAADARFLAGSCVDIGGSELPYAPLVAALRTLVRETDRETLDDLVGAGGDELGRVLPELRPAGGIVASGDPLAQARLFEALLGLLSRLAREAPLVLVVEDLHWADPSTRGFLSFLVRNMRGERLLLVATYRTDELHSRHPLRRLLAEIERVRSVERLELQRFTRRELAAMLAAILDHEPEPRLVDELFMRSQGNAFFAEELLAAARGGGAGGVPDSLRDALTLRVRELSGEARQMLRVAAAAGSSVGHGLLAATAGLSDEELSQAVREAIEHNVLVRDPGSESYSFRHALLREALHDDLLPGEGAALHRTLAEALERDPALAAGAYGAAAERASHWYAAHELSRALAASLEAAAEAERVFAFAEANGHLERAVELWERVPTGERPSGTKLVELVRRAAEDAHLAGENERAVALARRALVLLEAEEDSTAAGLVHERIARYLIAQGASRASLEEYRAAAALVPDEPSEVRASILAGQGHILMLEGDAKGARELCEEAIAIAGEVGAVRVECNALNSLGGALAIMGARDEAIALLRRAKSLGEELGAQEELVRSYVNLGEALDEADRLEEAAELGLEGWERLRRRVSSTALMIAAEAGNRLVRLGRWDDAARLLDEAAEAPAASVGGAFAFAMHANLELLRGDFESAEIHLERAQRDTVDLLGMYSLPIQARLAALALARGRPDEARAAVTAAMTVVGGAGGGYPLFTLPAFAAGLQAEADLAVRARAEADAAAEREAVEHAGELLSHARAIVAGAWPLGTPPTEANIQTQLCELEAARARDEASADDWASFAARCEEGRRPFEAAYARLREAEAALGAGLPRARVAEALEPARRTAVRLRARPLIAQLDEVARRARVSVVDEAETPATAAGLTERELDVLRLVAEGMTNPEIGKALYMSPKTASVHVSRILGKLGVKSRVEAAGVAHRLGLTR
jgi:DNA-binding CsgD family transcriptional regulator/tetratricopeptide (TPR) repeat protein